MSTPPEVGARQRQQDYEAWLSRVASAAYEVDLYQMLRRVASAHPLLPPLGEALRPKDEPLRVAPSGALVGPEAASVRG